MYIFKKIFNIFFQFLFILLHFINSGQYSTLVPHNLLCFHWYSLQVLGV